ncbi:MAG TPA: hypothetical protein VF902_04945 [Coriobacteriia bacterium]
MVQKAFGDASDFYRVRMMHVDDSESPDLEWREDILYRLPPVQDVAEFEMWRVEAVSVDDEDDVTVLGLFDDPNDAHEALAAAEQDLEELTRPQFEERYFPAEG